MFNPQALLAEATNEPATEQVNPAEQAAASEEAQATETDDIQSNEPSNDDNQETEESPNTPDSELTPEQLAKRELNRQSRINAKLAKQRLKEENRELKARLEKLEQTLPKQNTQADYPKEEDYESFLDYVKAVAKHEAKQEYTAAKEQSAPQVDAAKVQRLQEQANKELEFAKQVPDYERIVYQENPDFMNNIPLHIQEALLECDNASLALYALAKENRLEDLDDLEDRALDRVLAQAEERGKAYLTQVKKVSSAPPPIESLKGTGRTTKHDSELSVQELLAKYNK